MNMTIHEWMEYGIVWIINLYGLMQEWLLEDLKLEASKRQGSKTQRQKTQSADQIQALLHYTAYALSDTRTEILIFFEIES